ncbi:hypothetical protein [Paracoccus marinaquae]|uniref:Transposase n=1 Tax=Paracoccus marinaquae TaxID=2841926 RepID=A0ABS6ANZ0_9RHOB|nr:hypothetical protein [Paracoccus marinaquae]MBU3032311.1 hypothetical protein [Paracoccus marinaquae]
MAARLAGVGHPVTGQGTCPGSSEPTATAIRQVLGPDVELIIPPPKNAIPGDCDARNAHLEMIAEHGRMAWQKATGYGQQSCGEAQIGRYKAVIGPNLRSRKMETQTTETKIATRALNRMTQLASEDVL